MYSYWFPTSHTSLAGDTPLQLPTTLLHTTTSQRSIHPTDNHRDTNVPLFPVDSQTVHFFARLKTRPTVMRTPTANGPKRQETSPTSPTVTPITSFSPGTDPTQKSRTLSDLSDIDSDFAHTLLTTHKSNNSTTSLRSNLFCKMPPNNNNNGRSIDNLRRLSGQMQAALTNTRVDDANLRRSNRLTAHHANNARQEKKISTRVHQLEVNYHRAVHNATFLSVAPVNRVTTTICARAVVIKFRSTNRNRDPAFYTTVVDRFLKEIRKVRYFSDHELNFIRLTSNAFPHENAPAPVGDNNPDGHA